MKMWVKIDFAAASLMRQSFYQTGRAARLRDERRGVMRSLIVETDRLGTMIPMRTGRLFR